MVSNVSADITVLAKSIISILGDSSFQKEVSEIVRNSIDRNFSSGGRYGDGAFGGGNEAWTFSNRAMRDSSNPLSSTGKLLKQTLASVKVSYGAQGLQITAGSNLVYARIHQLGGKIPITAKSRGFFLYQMNNNKKNRGKWAALFAATQNKSEFNMPARPYIVLQDSDIDDIINALGKRIGK
jgi:phage gpG-like protein